MYYNYCTRTKFCGINFCALAGSEFRGSIFSCGVIFVDTRCSRSEINFQLRSYTRNVKFIRIPTKMGLFIVAIGIPCIMDIWEGHRELSQTEQCIANCWTMQGSLLYAWKYNKPCTRRPCMCQETFMQSANLFLRGEIIAAI